MTSPRNRGAGWRHHPYSPQTRSVDSTCQANDQQVDASLPEGYMVDDNGFAAPSDHRSQSLSTDKGAVRAPQAANDATPNEAYVRGPRDIESGNFDSVGFKFFGTPSLTSSTPSYHIDTLTDGRPETVVLAPAAAPATATPESPTAAPARRAKRRKQQQKVWDSFQDLALCPRQNRFVPPKLQNNHLAKPNGD